MVIIRKFLISAAVNLVLTTAASASCDIVFEANPEASSNDRTIAILEKYFRHHFITAFEKMNKLSIHEKNRVHSLVNSPPNNRTIKLRTYFAEHTPYSGFLESGVFDENFEPSGEEVFSVLNILLYKQEVKQFYAAVNELKAKGLTKEPAKVSQEILFIFKSLSEQTPQFLKFIFMQEVISGVPYIAATEIEDIYSVLEGAGFELSHVIADITDQLFGDEQQLDVDLLYFFLATKKELNPYFADKFAEHADRADTGPAFVLALLKFAESPTRESYQQLQAALEFKLKINNPRKIKREVLYELARLLSLNRGFNPHVFDFFLKDADVSPELNRLLFSIVNGKGDAFVTNQEQWISLYETADINDAFLHELFERAFSAGFPSFDQANIKRILASKNYRWGQHSHVDTLFFSKLSAEDAINFWVRLVNETSEKSRKNIPTFTLVNSIESLATVIVSRDDVKKLLTSKSYVSDLNIETEIRLLQFVFDQSIFDKTKVNSQSLTLEAVLSSNNPAQTIPLSTELAAILKKIASKVLNDKVGIERFVAKFGSDTMVRNVFTEKAQGSRTKKESKNGQKFDLNRSVLQTLIQHDSTQLACIAYIVEHFEDLAQKDRDFLVQIVNRPEIAAHLEDSLAYQPNAKLAVLIRSANGISVERAMPSYQIAFEAFNSGDSFAKSHLTEIHFADIAKTIEAELKECPDIALCAQAILDRALTEKSDAVKREYIFALSENFVKSVSIDIKNVIFSTLIKMITRTKLMFSDLSPFLLSYFEDSNLFDFHMLTLGLAFFVRSTEESKFKEHFSKALIEGTDFKNGMDLATAQANMRNVLASSRAHSLMPDDQVLEKAVLATILAKFPHRDLSKMQSKLDVKSLEHLTTQGWLNSLFLSSLATDKINTVRAGEERTNYLPYIDNREEFLNEMNVLHASIISSQGEGTNKFVVPREISQKMEMLSMAASIEYEFKHGRFPIDVSSDGKLGYDILSVDFMTGDIRLIEVKSRTDRKKSIVISQNEMSVLSRKNPHLGERDQPLLYLCTFKFSRSEYDLRRFAGLLPSQLSYEIVGEPGAPKKRYFVETLQKFELKSEDPKIRRSIRPSNPD